MPEILETNVKIKADASSLKKETKDSIKLLEQLKEEYKQVSNELSRAFATRAKSSVIQQLTDQRNELLKTINTIKAGDIETEAVKMKQYTDLFAHTESMTKFSSDISDASTETGKLTEKWAELRKNLLNSLDSTTASLEKLKNRLEAARAKTAETVKEAKRFNLSKIFEFKNNEGLKTALNGIKKIALAILGIRTVFTVITKAMNTYLSQNDELKAKIDGIYYALGSLLAPILEWIVNLFAKLLVYLNAFLRGLGFAGIQLKAAAKSTSKTASDVSKALAGFDEINNLNESKSGGSGAGGISDPFKDANVDTGLIEWIEAKAKDILAIVLGIVAAIAAMKLGLETIKSLGVGLAVAGLVALIQDFIDFIKDPSWEGFVKILIDIAAIVAGLAVAFGVVTGGWAVALVALGALLIAFRDDIAKIIVDIGTNIVNWFVKTWEAIKQKWNDMVTAASELWEALKEAIMESGFNLKNDLTILWQNIKNGLGEIWKQIKSELSKSWNDMKTTVTNIVTNIKNGVTNAWNNIKTTTSSVFNSVKSTFTNVWNGIWNVVRGTINKIIGGVETMVNSCINGINSLTSGLRSIGNSVLRAVGISGFSFGSISTINLPRLSTGTNYIPNDMIAQLHQGEAVIPKKFNEEQFMNGAETNRLLMQLIEVVDSKEFRAYVSSKDIGRASTEYISNQSRLLGRSVI